MSVKKLAKKRQAKGKTADGSKPSNPELYARVKAEAKKKFDRWPSAYGSSWLVKEYKKKGGKYSK